MGVNKVEVGDEVKLDLTEDTVSENNLLAGATAHNAAGEPITGAVVVAPIDSELSEISENAVQNKVVTAVLNNKANKSEIPSSLPANGGNADTVGGLSPDVIAHGYQASYTDANLCLNSGFYMMIPGSANIPVAAYGILLVSNADYPDSAGTWISQRFFTTDGLSAYSRLIVNGEPTNWKEISLTPIKSTAFSGTTDSNGNLTFLSISERKIPIFVSLYDCYCIPFFQGNGTYGIHVTNAYGNVTNKAINCTIYYIDGVV